MQIDRIIIKNIGPFTNLNLELNGKSVTFVGENGSGKTLLISSIVDFVYEHLREIGFRDVMKTEGNAYNYFRITSSSFLNNPQQHGIIWISGKINEKDIYYAEEYGYQSVKEAAEELQIPEAHIPWPNQGVSKATKSFMEEKVKNEAQNYIRKTPVIFLPATRFENESWKTEKYFDSDYSIDSPFNSSLGHSIELYKSFKENYTWLTNILFNYVHFKVYEDRLNTINLILSSLLGKKVAVKISPTFNDRLCIVDEEGEISIRSFSHLSLGQMSVLNIVLNILRESDQNISIESIKGLIIIDEIDAHLTGSYKTEILPKIIKLFPQIQFVVTTHDPLSVIGLENCSEQKLLELPTGDEILAKNFSEVKLAREGLRKQNSELRRIVEGIASSNKPALIVEDEHSEIYKVAWLKINGIEFSRENLDAVFSQESPFNIVSANGHHNTYALFSMNSFPEEIINKKLIGLFDFDEAFNSFLGLKQNGWGDRILGDASSGLYKNNNSMIDYHVMTLPIPRHRQALASEKYGDKSRLSIELLFTDKCLGANCCVDEGRPGKVKCFSGKKATFWKDCCAYDASEFKHFKKLFKRINELFGIA